MEATMVDDFTSSVAAAGSHQPAFSQTFALDSVAAAGDGKLTAEEDRSEGAPSSEEDESLDGDLLLQEGRIEDEKAGGALEDGKVRIPIRARVSVETEEIGDGEASFGSAESFDSALERMATSSSASNDAFASPKGSPVGSYSTPGVWSGLEVAQRGALMRLNELNSGYSSLDVSVISSSNSVEDFRDRVGRIAERNGLFSDDAAVKNILELLVPLVQNISFSSNGNGNVAVNGERESWAGNETPMVRPVAKLTEEDDPMNNSDEDFSVEDDAGEPGRPEIHGVEDDADLSVQEGQDKSHAENLQSAQGFPVVGAEDTELDVEKLSSSLKTVADAEKTDAEVKRTLDVQTDNEESQDHTDGLPDVKEEKIELVEKETKQQESNLQNSMKEKLDSSVPEDPKLEARDSKEESEDQKLREGDVQEVKHVYSEVPNEGGHDTDSILPVEGEPEHEEKNQFSLEQLETKGEEADDKLVVESSTERELESVESSDVLDLSDSRGASAAQDLEIRDGNEEVKGGVEGGHESSAAVETGGAYSIGHFELGHEPPVVLEISGADRSENPVASEREDQMQVSTIVSDSSVSEKVDIEKENSKDVPVADLVLLSSFPMSSQHESGTQPETSDAQEAKELAEQLVPNLVKDEEDKPDAVESESVVSEIVDQEVKLTENSVKESPVEQDEKDIELEQQSKTVEAGDKLESANAQLAMDDSATLEGDASDNLKSNGKESLQTEIYPEDQLFSSVSEGKSGTEITAIVQTKEENQTGTGFSLAGEKEQFSHPTPSVDTLHSENCSRADSLKSSDVGAAFEDEEEDEEEESYWNDNEIADDDKDEEDEDSMERAAALAALVRAVDSSKGGSGNPSLGSAGPSLPARPAGLGRSMPSLDPAPRVAQQSNSNGVAASQPAVAAETNHPNGDANDGNAETREKLQAMRVKFLRLAHRLGQSAQNVVVAQVLYRLGLAEQLRGGRSTNRSSAFSFDRASAIAEEQEAAGQEELDFTCTIMLLGKTGVGKSATINSIFDEIKVPTNAFTFATKRVQEITGTVHGIKLRIIDTPGLLPSVADQRQNEKIMASVKHFIKRSSPDIVLYFDRLDMQSRDFGDLPLLRTITDTFGAAIWFNAIVVLTHASSAPPDGPNGVPVSYEMFVAQRSHVVQQTIRQAAGDTRLMNPVSLVENHPACRTNRAGERVLPNGQVWKPQLLLLSFASKILAEANSLLKLQENAPGKPFGTRTRVPPLPFLLSSLLQSRAQLKMPNEQIGEEDESDDDVEEEESDDEADYDELPPFRRLRKEELEELDKEQRRLYFEELEYREKLFQKKQWKEELKRRKEMKKRMGAGHPADMPLPEEMYEEDGAKSAAVPVALPDMALPPTFDSDNPSHRYRYLETASQWLVRPVLETHGWDHDSGYDGLNLEKAFIVGNKVPVSLSGQITKDKKEANITLESAASFRHGEGKVTLAGFDVQTMGKDLSYTLRSETRFSNFKRNKTIAGLALTMLGDTIAAGLKLEDRLTIGKRLKLVMNGGAITGRKDVAYGGTLEITVRDKDYPISRTLSTLGLSVMDWHGDLAIGGNLQSQFVLGKTMMVARGNLNNRGAGQISIRASSSEQLQMAMIGLIPIVRAIFGSRLFNSSHSN